MFIKEQFIGREEVVKLINKRICDFADGYRQNIALLGDELIGKTWIIKYIFDNITNTKIIPFYFDLNQPTAQIFIQRFISTLLYGFLKTKSIAFPKENLTKLIEEATIYLPFTTSKIKEIIQNLKKDKLDISNFKDALLLLETIHQETEKKIVVIFDEFQNLELLKVRNIFQEFGKKIMTQKDTMYIISSSNKKRAKIVIQDELSLLFGNFEIIDLGNFDNKTSEIIIKSRLKNLKASQDIINFIINFTGGHPFYLDKITQQIQRNAMILETDTITPFVFIYSIEDILFNRWGLLNLRFQHFIDLLNSKNKPDTIEILTLIAQGKNRIKDISVILHKNYRDINHKLTKLIESDLVYRTGSFYYITDRVFNFWLNFVYLEKINNLSQNYEDQVISFRRKIEQMLIEFIEASKKNVTQRLYDLFISFSNDSVQLGRNKILLSRFKEIKPLNFEGHFIKNGFICYSELECWIVGLKEGDITERSVSEFIKESENIKLDNVQFKRLIIGLDKTELNARLLAKEKKITTWELDHLNLLLDLYGKPRLVTHK